MLKPSFEEQAIIAVGAECLSAGASFRLLSLECPELVCAREKPMKPSLFLPVGFSSQEEGEV